MIHYNSEIVYPKLCAVFELPAQRFVYPIFKNASSSLEELSVRKIYNSKINDSTQTVDVYWREAQNRFNSGVNTYLQHNKLLDTETIINLVERGELVNRHFMPQYMWLCHLYKHYTGTVNIKDVNSLDIAIHKNNSGYAGSFVAPTHWIDLDNLIYDEFVGKTTVIEEINEYIESKSRVLYNKCIAQE
jgi:hypothetical protein